jgi:kynurenine formamidase
VNRMVYNDELFSGEIGQIGTQFDGLGHIGIRIGEEDVFYNGNKLSEFGDTYGLKKLGIENAGPFVTRGVLLDVCAMRGNDRLPVGYVISPDELESCLDKAKLEIQPGDVVLIRTGHGKLWMKDNEAYGGGEPGIGLAAAKFLTDRKVALIGTDTWGIECVPHEDPKTVFPVHQWNLTKNGVYHLENLDLEELAASDVREFCFMFSPLRLKGATGSPGNPVAIR